ncbi:hypothetical protein BDB00DRAFT_510949 [Zychaea mexicana]|uniref:uncharacterized protein n=1 Tax=Zychaea mexicana TaxID=64656 RepID=UPI0022FE3D09|nr:uncharacterized protein BDB00DRAFT_510949 [Zychaea mexicana]KAI9491183.1 hypothetical protein BDB00DRAFT_510949 [Zychaea mexicana]
MTLFMLLTLSFFFLLLIAELPYSILRHMKCIISFSIPMRHFSTIAVAHIFLMFTFAMFPTVSRTLIAQSISTSLLTYNKITSLHLWIDLCKNSAIPNIALQLTSLLKSSSAVWSGKHDAISAASASSIWRFRWLFLCKM